MSTTTIGIFYALTASVCARLPLGVVHAFKSDLIALFGDSSAFARFVPITGTEHKYPHRTDHTTR